MYKAASGKAVSQLTSDWSWAHLNIRPSLWLEVGPLWKTSGILQYKILTGGLFFYLLRWALNLWPSSPPFRQKSWSWYKVATLVKNNRNRAQDPGFNTQKKKEEYRLRTSSILTWLINDTTGWSIETITCIEKQLYKNWFKSLYWEVWLFIITLLWARIIGH